VKATFGSYGHRKSALGRAVSLPSALEARGARVEHYTHRPGRLRERGKLPVNTDGWLETIGKPAGAAGGRMIFDNTPQLQDRD
jgi:acetyl-CoA acetyltransferase